MYDIGFPGTRDRGRSLATKRSVTTWQLLSNWSRHECVTTLGALSCPCSTYWLIVKSETLWVLQQSFVTCVIWCFLSFRVGLSRSRCRPNRCLIITMSSRLQSTFWPLDRCACLMSSYLSPQFKCITFYACTSGLCSVYLCSSGFLRSKCKDTLIKTGTSLWSTWKWCTETVLSITVRRTYTAAINITNLPTCKYLTN